MYSAHIRQAYFDGIDLKKTRNQLFSPLRSEQCANKEQTMPLRMEKEMNGQSDTSALVDLFSV